MAFIEEQQKGGKKYYYLTQTVRAGNSFKKVRVLLADKTLSKQELDKIAAKKQKELSTELYKYRKTNVFFDPNLIEKNPPKHKFLVWERPCRIVLAHTAAECLGKPLKKRFGWHWGNSYCFLRQNMVKAVWDTKYVIKSGIYVINNMLDNKYFDSKLKENDKLLKRLLNEYDKIEKSDLPKLTDKKLIDLFKEFHSVFLDWWSFAQIEEPIDHAAEFLLRKVIPEKYFAIITSPSEKSYTTIEEEELFKIALKVKQNKNALRLFAKDNKTIKKSLNKFREINNLLAEHVKKYFWLQTNYYESIMLDTDYFIDEIKSIIRENVNINEVIRNNDKRLAEVKREKAELIKNLDIDDRYKKLIKLIDFFCIFRDDRKALSLRGNHYMSIFINEISRRTGIDKNLLYWCTPYEVPAIVDRKFEVNELKKRQEHMTFIVTEKGIKIITGKESIEFEKKILGNEFSQDVQEFEGMRAQGGKVTGEVIKILDPREGARFKEGCILVTTMTSPDFVPIMKKAIAIITDEGGITSHASIVAREFGIPCVIATKIATNVLNDGDKVEVNANHGVIKILERK